MAAEGTSLAENASTCPVDAVPVQILSSRRDGPVTTLSDARKPDNPLYDTFITTVTKHLATKLAQENLCPTPYYWDFSSIKFARLPYCAQEDDNTRSALSPLQVRPSGVCRLSSPWIDLAIGRDPIPKVRAIVRFNERQILADQAVMAGVRNVATGVAMPPTHKEFLAYTFEYDKYVSEERAARYDRSGNSRPKSTDNPIEERVPPDYLWLFRQGGSGGSAPFAVYAKEDIKKTTRKGAEGYTKIVIALIDQCFASDGAEIHYNSILDIDDPALLKQYKIVTPLR
jgi:hypothetical protein